MHGIRNLMYDRSWHGSAHLRTMLLRYTVAVLHLLALAIGLAAVYGRWRALRRLKGAEDLPAVFHADNWYGLAAVLWVATGLWRAFGGLEKGSAYYLESHWFLGKLGLFGMVGLLEIFPMFLLVRWRMERKRGRTPDLRHAPVLARLTLLELPLLVAIVCLAAAMARGL
jgi:putative membrane protein